MILPKLSIDHGIKVKAKHLESEYFSKCEDVYEQWSIIIHITKSPGKELRFKNKALQFYTSS